MIDLTLTLTLTLHMCTKVHLCRNELYLGFGMMMWCSEWWSWEKSEWAREWVKSNEHDENWRKNCKLDEDTLLQIKRVKFIKIISATLQHLKGKHAPRFYFTILHANHHHWVFILIFSSDTSKCVRVWHQISGDDHIWNGIYSWCEFQIIHTHTHTHTFTCKKMCNKILHPWTAKK